MGLLLLLSIVSWFLIFRKRSVLGRARREAEAFEDRFWKGRDLNTLYNRVTARGYVPTGMELIFESGYTEFARLRRQQGMEPMALVEGAQRAMRVVFQREMDRLEHHLPTLATIGSVSPYIGLFGTVWGIMHSFHGLAEVQQATLQMVAPGISEALIATAMGLFAAIPAVMAYNGYASEIDRLGVRYDTFLDEFTSVLQRQAYTPSTAAPVQPVAQAPLQGV
jgi:biopolymer transport protein TolQ